MQNYAYFIDKYIWNIRNISDTVYISCPLEDVLE